MINQSVILQFTVKNSKNFSTVHTALMACTISRPCLSSTHVSSMSIQSFPYAQSRLYCAVYAHSLRHISHIQQSTYIIYITYLWYAWRQSWRCAKYSNLVSVAAFHDSLAICEMTTRSKSAADFWWHRRQFTMCSTVVSFNLQQLSSCTTKVRARVSIRVRVSLSTYS